MTSIVTNAGAVGDHGHGPFQREADAQPHTADPAAAPKPAAEDPADVRLLIEDDHANGEFIYTTVDRRTGTVIRQLPRDRLLQLSAAPDYAAGALIKTRA
jgi:hypothetical protein